MKTNKKRRKTQINIESVRKRAKIIKHAKTNQKHAKISKKRAKNVEPASAHAEKHWKPNKTTQKRKNTLENRR